MIFGLIGLVFLMTNISLLFDSGESLSGFIMWGVFTTAFIAVFLSPASLFGRWKGELYKEKLEWDAFAAFLSDHAQISRYQSADLAMWGEWLVYGTSLGVGAKVAAEMEKLQISLPDLDVMPALALGGLYSMYSPISSFSSDNFVSSGDSGGGSFGGGGGGGW